MSIDFLITNTFADSMQKLTNDEQKAVKITVFDLQQDINHPGLRWHKIDKVRDPNFSSVSVNMDIRLIVYRSDKHLLICYVDHHDKAYRWATNRKIQAHPKTGAAQIVEIRETVKEIVVPVYVDKPIPTSRASNNPKLLFAELSTDQLLSYGVPEEWIDDVRQATEDSILTLADYLPQEAADALLELATGGQPQMIATPTVPTENDPFLHPDAQRRFRVLANVEELERALEYPWEKWTVFLHPSQRQIVEKQFNGPARVSGSAGTGKTIVALHRAVYLARKHKHARVLITTFSDTLARALQTKLKRLVGNEPLVHERIDVQSIHAAGQQLYEATFGKPNLADNVTIQSLLRDQSDKVTEHRFTDAFIWAEWQQVVDAWQLHTWEEYRDVQRLGRKTRLSEQQRQLLWSIFNQIHQYLHDKNQLTQASLMAKVTDHLQTRKNGPYDFIVVDEAQDIGVAELRLLAAMGAGSEAQEDALFFAGDLGQRIFQPPFSWKSLGVEIRGRSRTLKINYRTSHQIRRQADRLLPPELTDVDGNSENRKGTISVFNGPEPMIETFDDEQSEINAVACWLKQQIDEGIAAHEIGVFIRSSAQMSRAQESVNQAGLNGLDLQDQFETQSDHVSICAMHLAKGLEFRGVVVMACDDEVLPLQERIEAITDHADLQEVYSTERHLLYVSCTRARDHLYITGVAPISEFIDDLKN